MVRALLAPVADRSDGTGAVGRGDGLSDLGCCRIGFDAIEVHPVIVRDGHRMWNSFGADHEVHDEHILVCVQAANDRLEAVWCADTLTLNKAVDANMSCVNAIMMFTLLRWLKLNCCMPWVAA